MPTTDESAYRVTPPSGGDERELLRGFVDFHRGTLLWKTSGLTGEQLVTTSTEPSTMSLIGLVRHLTEVERYWFQLCLAGRPVTLQHWTTEHPDGDFDLVDPGRVEQDLADYQAVIKISDEIAGRYDLDHTFRRPRRNNEYSVRWLYLHLVEEYSRHNGHADLIRERIDGTTGE